MADFFQIMAKAHHRNLPIPPTKLVLILTANRHMTLHFGITVITTSLFDRFFK